jgi:beta-lactam-binding protein with PASTA domain
VPKVAKGSSKATVRTKLASAHCALGDVTKKFSRKVKRGKLIKLKTKDGTELAAGAKVAAVFSKGKPKR